MKLRPLAIVAQAILVVSCGADAPPEASMEPRTHAELMQPLLLASQPMELDECLKQGAGADRCRSAQALEQGDASRCFDTHSPAETIRCLGNLREGEAPPVPTEAQCESLTLGWSAQCIAIRAVALGDAQLCDRLDFPGRERCLDYYGRQSGSASACEAIENAHTRDGCRVAIAARVGPGVCAKVAVDQRASCVSAAFEGAYLSDYLKLDSRTREQVARGAIEMCTAAPARGFECALKVVDSSGDLALCGLLDESSWQVQRCVNDVKVPRDCLTLERGIVRDHCIVLHMQAYRRSRTQRAGQREVLAPISCGLIQDPALERRCEQYTR